MHCQTILVLAALCVAAVAGSREARQTQGAGTGGAAAGGAGTGGAGGAGTGGAGTGGAATGGAARGGAGTGGAARGGAATGGAARGGAAAAAGPAACNPPNCVCYPPIGCFRKRAQCVEANAPLPESPQKIGTAFRLYTRGNREIKTISPTMSATAIFAAGFDSRRATKILIHGWTQNANSFDGLKNVLLKKGDFNIIMVDWEKGAGISGRWPLAYTLPVQNTRVVGKQIAMMISHLSAVANTNPLSVHIVGASLGAQAAGYVGMYMNGTVGRISGLDPAKPNFEGQPIECKLDKTDAQFVDVIHTNMDVAGVAESVGDIDFFPNGGRSQPGCSSPICSHLRAKSFFRSSIWTDCQFKTHRCDGKPCGPQGCPNMGLKAFKPRGRIPDGNYCLTTTDRPPYCIDVTAAPKFGPHSVPKRPNGNPHSPNVGTGVDKTTWFNQGKPMSPGINTGNAGQKPGQKPGVRSIKPQAQNSLDDPKSAGVCHQTIFTMVNIVLLAITARLL